MRPYLAVIKDSFREAFATRVLWIMLILIAVLLALLAPFGYRDALAISLGRSDIRETDLLVAQLKEHAADAQTPAGHIWSKLSKQLRNDLQEVKQDGDRHQRMRSLGRLRRELSDLLIRAAVYDKDIWAAVPANREMKKLLKIAASDRSDEQAGRLNRLALDAAFPESISPVGAHAIQPVYFSYEVGDEIPVTKQQMQQAVSLVLVDIVSILLGNLGVFIAILVTASIIPQMLDAGAIDLLLSKPVSRPLLFLSKFIGGCGFILMNATVMIVGLWLIVGLRFDIWSTGLLWTIPVFVFVFAIYYSVSTLAAVIWKNAVVSIVVSIIFWAVCLGVGYAKHGADSFILNPRRTAAIIPTDDSMLITNNRGTGFEWDKTKSVWQEVFEQRQRGPQFMQSYPFLGPVYDRANNKLLAVRVPQRRARWMPSTANLVVADPQKDWKPSQSISVPTGTKFLGFSKAGVPIIAGPIGIHEIHGDLSKEQQGLKLLGFELPNGEGAHLVRVDDKDRPVWREPFAIGHDAQTDQFAVVSANTLSVLARDKNDRYQVVVSTERETSTPALIANVNGTIVVAEQDGTVRVFDSKTLKEQASDKPLGTNEPQALHLAANGESVIAAVVYHNRNLAVLEKTLSRVNVPLVGNGNVSVVKFFNGGLFVGERFGRVTRYDLTNGFKQTDQLTPPSEFVEDVYEMAIRPIHAIFPKPADMDNFVAWLMTDQETIALGDNGLDLSADRIILDVWDPLWSNLLFLGVMLSLTCLIISRRDF